MYIPKIITLIQIHNRVMWAELTIFHGELPNIPRIQSQCVYYAKMMGSFPQVLMNFN